MTRLSFKITSDSGFGDCFRTFLWKPYQDPATPRFVARLISPGLILPVREWTLNFLGTICPSIREHYQFLHDNL